MVLDGVHASLPGRLRRSSPERMEVGITSSPSSTRITGDSNGYLLQINILPIYEYIFKCTDSIGSEACLIN